MALFNVSLVLTMEINELMEIWQQKFGDKEYGFDFANQLVLKDQYKTNTPYSWDVDFYDYEDSECFIANIKTIKSRNKQALFVFENQTYVIAKNPDFSYSIINPKNLPNLNNPLNIDLYISNKINEIEQQKQKEDYIEIMILLKFKKIKIKYQNWLFNIINDFIKVCWNNFSAELSNNEFKTEVKIRLKIDNEETNKFMANILKLNSIIMLLFFRLIAKYKKDIWNNEEEFEYFYNILIGTICETETKDFIFSLDNKIIIFEQLKNIFIQKGFNKNEFKYYDELDEVVFFEYPYVNLEFNSYLKNIKKK